MPKPAALAPLTLPSVSLASKEEASASFTPLSAPLSSPSRKKGIDGDSSCHKRLNRSPVNIPYGAPISPASPRFTSDKSKGLFSNIKASKSSTRIVYEQALGHSTNHSNDSSGSIYSHRHSPGSTPELTLVRDHPNTTELLHKDSAEHIRPQHGFLRADSDSSTIRKEPSIPRLDRFLGRSNSTSDQDQPSQVFPRSAAPTSAAASKIGVSDRKAKKANGDHIRPSVPDKERSLRERMASNMRNRSADRNHSAIESEDEMPPPRDKREAFSLSSSFKESSGTAFLHNIKYGSTKAADGLGKAGKGFFGKFSRSGSSQEREPPKLDEDYVCKIINLPLVEQARRTRISKRLADSKDKTEFWMPALPWRCIDYLNMKGCEAEGLYRVPGSGRDIRYWQMRFDKECDINLFDEPELYDINIIGSMFKAWLRELPDEIFPRHIQEKIAKECKDATSTPQMLKDELSKLPPFNYYLLFAITCHISLLHSCSQYNKMDYRNLCICFQPCLKVDGFCFQWLVLDWRNCWQGCWTEETFLAIEVGLLEGQENASQAMHQKSSKPRKSAGTKVKSSKLGSSHADSRTAQHVVSTSTSPFPRLGNGERSSSSGSGASSKVSGTRSTTPDNSHQNSNAHKNNAIRVDTSKVSQSSMHSTYQVSTPQQAIAEALPPSPAPQSPSHKMTSLGHSRQLDDQKPKTKIQIPSSSSQTQQNASTEKLTEYQGKSEPLAEMPWQKHAQQQHHHQYQSQEKSTSHHNKRRSRQKQDMNQALIKPLTEKETQRDQQQFDLRRRSSAPDRAVTTDDKDDVSVDSVPSRRTSIAAPTLLEPVQPLSPIGSI